MVWIFDYDNVLYPPSSGLLDTLDIKINEFISKKLNKNLSESNFLRKHYFAKHGTTIEGLIREHKIDPSEYYEFILDIDIKLDKDPELKNILASSPFSTSKLHIFSNGIKKHITHGLEMIGILEFFDEIFDISFNQYKGKPSKEAFLAVEKHLEVCSDEIIFVDDNIRNIETAVDMKWNAVFVSWEKDKEISFSNGYYTIGSTHDIQQISFDIKQFSN